jgi:outer membrane protein OmpA-like peptidoglycan-associated protein
MAFNLNKNDGPAGPSKKTSFDLSKTDNPEPKKPAYWLYALIALLVVGGAAWYFTGRGAQGKLPLGDTIVNSAGRQMDTVTADTTLPASQTGTRVAAASRPGMPVFAASFKAGSVKPGGTAGSVVAGIRKKMKAGAEVKVSVFGYASSEGSPEVNQRISQQRADAYKRMLVRKGIAEENITAQGRGIENPVAPNDTEVGRRKNRRVEVSFE